jgi:hypothetical protein
MLQEILLIISEVNNRRISDGRRHDEEPAGISDHKRMLAISADKRASVNASAIREEGRGKVTKCVDEKSGTEGKGNCWQGSDVLHHDRSLIEWESSKGKSLVEDGFIIRYLKRQQHSLTSSCCRIHVSPTRAPFPAFHLKKLPGRPDLQSAHRYL